MTRLSETGLLLQCQLHVPHASFVVKTGMKPGATQLQMAEKSKTKICTLTGLSPHRYWQKTAKRTDRAGNTVPD
jgi:hypothetical protein